MGFWMIDVKLMQEGEGEEAGDEYGDRVDDDEGQDESQESSESVSDSGDRPKYKLNTLKILMLRLM